MLAVVFSLRENWHCLQGAVLQTTIFSDHQNLTYFQTAILLNRRQVRWAEELAQHNFQLFNREGSSNLNADILSRCPAFISREQGTTSATNQTMLHKEQWLEVGAMELDLSKDFETIQIWAISVDQLLPEAKEKIKEKVMLDDKDRELFKQVSNRGKYR
jgi:hypothetical protein